MIMDIEKLALQEGLLLKTTNLDLCPSYIGKLSKFAEAYHQAKCNEELQTLRAKVASADVLAEALRTIRHNAYMDGSNKKTICDIFKVADKVIMTYDKLSEVKHDTK